MSDGSIADVVPHTGDMILLDRIELFEDDRIVCVKTLRVGGMFQDADGNLPAWAGVELMAQSIAAWAGCRARAERRPVQLGFLLGTRHYRCNVDLFPAGQCLRIEAERTFHDEHGMAVFSCRIDAPNVHAEARLNVCRPLSADAFFRHLAGATSHD